FSNRPESARRVECRSPAQTPVTCAAVIPDSGVLPDTKFGLRLALHPGDRPTPRWTSMSFDSLGLAEPLLRAVHEQGYTTPTPIQLQAIPAVLSGGDLLAGAQTGTGKTAGFTLPVLHRLSTSATNPTGSQRPIRALV